MRDGDLDRAGCELRVLRAVGPAPHASAHPHDELAAQGFGNFERCGVSRIERDLGETVAVAQIDEDQPAVVPAPVNPAGKLDVTVDVVRAVIEAAEDRLGDFPELGQARTDLAEGLRHLPSPPYLILYRAAPDPILVVRIVHGARDLPRLLEP